MLATGVKTLYFGIISPHVRKSKTFFGFWIPECEFRTSGTGFQSLLVELGYWIPIVSGILDPFSCIPDSKAQDSGSTSKVFLEIPQAKMSQIPESVFPYIGRNCLRTRTSPRSSYFIYYLPFFVTGANMSTQAVFGRRLRMKLNVSHKSRFFFLKRTKLDQAPWLTSSFVMETPGILHLL